MAIKITNRALLLLAALMTVGLLACITPASAEGNVVEGGQARKLLQCRWRYVGMYGTCGSGWKGACCSNNGFYTDCKWATSRRQCRQMFGGGYIHFWCGCAGRYAWDRPHNGGWRPNNHVNVVVPFGH